VSEEFCKCEECPLNGKPKVLSEGEGKVVIVGIAPAKEEVKLGRPFVGLSGKLLRSATEQLDYPSYYLTNTLLCEIPEECSSADLNKAIKCCRDRLLYEVDQLKPDLVIALGNIPLEVLTGDNYSITSVEGRVLPGLVCPVLPVVHPAAVLRRTDEFQNFFDALEVGTTWLNGTYRQASTPKVVIVDENNKAEAYQQIENAKLVSVDLETTGNGFFPYGSEKRRDKIRCIAISLDGEISFIIPGHSSPHFPEHPNFIQDDNLRGLLNKCDCIFQNGQFDCGFLWQEGYRTKIFYDTLLAHYLMDERGYSSGLKPMAKKYLGASDWESNIKIYLPHKKSSYDNIPDEVLYRYASHDAAYTYQLYDIFKEREDGTILRDLLLPSSNMFVDIRHSGILIDVDELVDTDTYLDEDINKIEKELEAELGYSINVFSSQEVVKLIYDQLELPVLPRFGRSSSVKVLDTYIDHPVVAKVKEARQLGKLKSTYVVGMAKFLDDNWRIHPFIKQFSTVTGRLSAEDPSVLNIVRNSRVKKQYLPNPGHWLGAFDQKQMELRIYALLANDTSLKDIFFSGNLDPHGIIRKSLLERTGKDYDRGKVKGGVFGLLYGRGKESFMYGFRISEEETNDLMSSIRKFFPGIGHYNLDIRESIHRDGFLESYFGRKRRFPLITRENKHELYRMGANFPIQSTASDINLFCMLHLYNLRDELGILPLFPIHDSIVIDIQDKESVPRIIDEIESFSRALVKDEMLFKVEAEIGRNWGETEKWK